MTGLKLTYLRSVHTHIYADPTFIPTPPPTTTMSTTTMTWTTTPGPVTPETIDTSTATTSVSTTKNILARNQVSGRIEVIVGVLVVVLLSVITGALVLAIAIVFFKKRRFKSGQYSPSGVGQSNSSGLTTPSGVGEL